MFDRRTAWFSRLVRNHVNFQILTIEIFSSWTVKKSSHFPMPAKVHYILALSRCLNGIISSIRNKTSHWRSKFKNRESCMGLHVGLVTVLRTDNVAGY